VEIGSDVRVLSSNNYSAVVAEMYNPNFPKAFICLTMTFNPELRWSFRKELVEYQHKKNGRLIRAGFITVAKFESLSSKHIHENVASVYDNSQLAQGVFMRMIDVGIEGAFLYIDGRLAENYYMKSIIR
jgi:hypothetical protein